MSAGRRFPRKHGRRRPRGAARRSERGAVALEYILIAAMMALGLVAAFRSFGQDVRRTINHSRAPAPEYCGQHGVGGALSDLDDAAGGGCAQCLRLKQ